MNNNIILCVSILSILILVIIYLYLLKKYKFNFVNIKISNIISLFIFLLILLYYLNKVYLFNLFSLFSFELVNLKYLSLSLISIIKSLIIILLLFVHIYLIYIEYKKPKIFEIKRKYMLSGIDIKLLKNIYLGLSASVGLYASILSIKDHYKYLEETNKLLDTSENKLDKLQKEVQSITEENTVVKNKLVAGTSRLENFKDNLQLELKKLFNLQKEYNENLNSDLIDKDSKIFYENKLLKIKKSYKEEEIRKSIENIEVEVNEKEETIKDNLTEKTIFNPFNLFDSLNVFDKIALSLLFSNTVIISSLISIVYIFYGDLLIKKFKLEDKYPKLAQIINLRRKFQQYYLILSILFILMCTLSQILFSIIVLCL